MLDLSRIPSPVIFHGSGPEDESVYFDTFASIGIAYSRDLVNWRWNDGSVNIS